MKKTLLIAVMALVAMAPLANAGTAEFVKLDDKTMGNWEGVYGKEGYKLAVDFAEKLPEGVELDTNNIKTFATFADKTDDARAPHKPGKKEVRLAACWWGNLSIRISVGQKPMQLSIYSLDWDGSNARAMQVEIMDGEKVLDKRELSAYSNGKYLVYNVTGTVTVKLTNTGYANAVISGFFFDPVQTK